MRIPFLLAAALAAFVLCDEARAGSVVLVGGDVLHGEVAVEGDVVRIEHVALGTLRLARDAVREVTSDAPAPVRLPTAVEAAAPAAGAEVVLAAALPRAEDPWSFELGVAVSATQGNSDTLDVHLDAAAGYERGPWTVASSLAYLHERGDGTRTAENWHAEGRVERRLFDCAYAFAQVHYDRDPFADLRHRIASVGGMGCVFAESRYAKLSGEGGGGFTWERRFGLEPTFDPSAYARLAYAYEGADGTALAASLEFLPNLDDFDLSLTTLETRLDKPINGPLSLSLGVRLEHVVDPPGDVEPLDLVLISGLRLEL